MFFMFGTISTDVVPRECASAVRLYVRSTWDNKQSIHSHPATSWFAGVNKFPIQDLS